MEVAKRIYIGGGNKGLQRLANIRRLADKHARGSVSALFNEALDKVYGLDKKTGEPLPRKK